MEISRLTTSRELSQHLSVSDTFGFQLSFERPMHGGFGNVIQTWDIPSLQWLTRRGVPFDVCTSRDLHFEAPDPKQYRLLLFAGHHEYWTAEMRTNVENFMRTGGMPASSAAMSAGGRSG